MDKETRNKLRNTVIDCRKLLEADVLDQLQGRFGIHRDGRIEPETALPHLDDEGLQVRRRAVAAIEHIEGYGLSQPDAVDQFQREVAFTHLNRLCAFKMMERRDLLQEAVSRGTNSNGFKVYLASHADDERRWRGGDEHLAYKNFLFDVCAQLSEEIKVLFDTEHVSSHLFPSHRALEGVLDLINAEPLADIWESDETIGWIYQYFTPKELREKARKESAAPRNSYELAFRNQFYTPLYVVQFLTDNTLGRTWYEMRKGETRLTEQCEYMVRRPTEIFLGPGEGPPPEPERDGDLSQEDLLKQPVHVRHREKKVPWEIKVLDPACGSGHFLLYSFALLETIYDEAYDDPDIGPRVQALHPNRKEYDASVPAMILRHNLHGIDIDLRSTQIAALALWMRAQRSFQRLGLNGESRPPIERTNLVCAEPMPGDEALLEEFCESLSPSLLGDLVRQVWDKMKLAGEAGSLLKIEEEIRDVVRRAQEAWTKAPKGYKISLFDGTVQRPVEQAEFDFSDVTGPEFWGKAEALLLDALALFASRAANGRQYGRRLFADDAEQGFAFIELSRGRYDVVLMNPPFGNVSAKSQTYIESTYPSSKGNILAHFLERSAALTGSRAKVGAIVSRTCFFLTSLDEFRTSILGVHLSSDVFADLGSGVLDAMVETAAVTFDRCQPLNDRVVFVRLLTAERKNTELLTCLESIRSGQPSRNVFLNTPKDFQRLPGSPYVYWITPAIIERIGSQPTLEPEGCDIRVGLQTGDDFRFLRLWFEVAQEQIINVPNVRDTEQLRRMCLQETNQGKTWAWYSKIDEASPLAASIHLVANWAWEGREIKAAHMKKGDSISRYVRSEGSYFKPGISYMLRSSRLVPYVVPRGVIPTAGRSQIYPKEGKELWVLALAASNVASAVARFRGENLDRPKFQNSMVASVPYVKAPAALEEQVSETLERVIHQQKQSFSASEVCNEFLTVPKDLDSRRLERLERSSLLGRDLDLLIASAFGLSESDMALLERDLMDSVSRPEWVGQSDVDSESEAKAPGRQQPYGNVHAVSSYAVGCALGRWDIRIVTSEKPAPGLPDPFTPLPVCPPGMLVGTDGLPARPGGLVSEEWLRARPNAITLAAEGSVSRPIIPDSEYPLDIVWDGILVDDPDHQDDIVRRVREVLELLWKDRAPAIEREACEILGVKDLREYFRHPKHFWDQHVKRYSKSRRKAPIYWLLQSEGRRYALWLYYHRLDRDMLFKALRNYVDPKHRLEESSLRELRERLPATPEGRERKALEKQIDEQEALVNEVLDFKERLEKVAALGLDPDLNDGVILNIAPLHELVPWKEPKKYWDDLLASKYEWSTIGKQLRGKGLVRG